MRRLIILAELEERATAGHIAGIRRAELKALCRRHPNGVHEAPADELCTRNEGLGRRHVLLEQCQPVRSRLDPSGAQRLVE